MCLNGSDLPNKMATRALDKKHLKTTSDSEPLQGSPAKHPMPFIDTLDKTSHKDLPSRTNISCHFCHPGQNIPCHFWQKVSRAKNSSEHSRATMALYQPCITVISESYAGPGVASLISVQSHTFMEIDHEIISTSADSSFFWWSL